VRIYLAGTIKESIEQDWRYSLLAPGTWEHPEGHPVENVMLPTGISSLQAQNYHSWEFKPKAVMGHDYVGPFPWRGGSEEFSYRKNAIKRADLVFTWSDSVLTSSIAKMELMFAEGCGKQVYIGRIGSVPRILDEERMFLVSVINHKDLNGSPTATLANAIAMTSESLANGGWRKFASKYAGKCKACSGVYVTNETIMYSKSEGCMHVDCYKAVYDDPKLSANIVFSKDLIQTLRKRVADLEKELFEEED
jgi:hypothetical protein